ncbi:uncharacterized protein N7479_004735 [Penicillium vulpinum]|uniref:uncharacterized protein n=1 Tax=Penicillium vulpinum TaxID=29845 RepID=UPI0025490155|nr:uncharacterized protein N7479_004735 [Penicillium vulpinum]KAJ5964859.1 hypothetical protein N7479_004735 [Penicillium vulpinum]
MSRDRTDILVKALEDDSALDISPNDLMPLCSEAVNLGILEPTKSNRQNQPKKNKDVSGKNQVDVFRDREYLYTADGCEYELTSNHLRQLLPYQFCCSENIGGGSVLVKIEICLLGERPSNGREIHRCATHVYILLGKSIEEIADSPRRYIYFWGGSHIPKGLE